MKEKSGFCEIDYSKLESILHLQFLENILEIFLVACFCTHAIPLVCNVAFPALGNLSYYPKSQQIRQWVVIGTKKVIF